MFLNVCIKSQCSRSLVETPRQRRLRSCALRRWLLCGLRMLPVPSLISGQHTGAFSAAAPCTVRSCDLWRARSPKISFHLWRARSFQNNVSLWRARHYYKVRTHHGLPRESGLRSYLVVGPMAIQEPPLQRFVHTSPCYLEWRGVACCPGPLPWRKPCRPGHV